MQVQRVKRRAKSLENFVNLACRQPSRLARLHLLQQRVLEELLEKITNVVFCVVREFKSVEDVLLVRDRFVKAELDTSPSNIAIVRQIDNFQCVSFSPDVMALVYRTARVLEQQVCNGQFLRANTDCVRCRPSWGAHPPLFEKLSVFEMANFSNGGY